MTFIASMLLVGAASPPPIYPTKDVLSELKAVCFNDYRYVKKQGFVGPVSDAIEHWIESAISLGWNEVSDIGKSRDARDTKVVHQIKSLDHALFGSFSQPWSNLEDGGAIHGGRIFKKSVAGRILYLSVFGADDGGGRTVGECRIHDLLGDGIHKNPVAFRDVKSISGGEVRRENGPFSSDRYRLNSIHGRVSELDVHFGFKGWRLTPFDHKIEQFDPYAPYGLTMVAGFHEQEIII
jgi:hypothetical protein